MNAATPKTSNNGNATEKTTVAVDASEVQALKARIEEMNKNIDQLTAMVEKVNLKQEQHLHQVPDCSEQEFFVGNKRKKVLVQDDAAPEPENVVSLPAISTTNFVVPESTMSTDVIMASMPEPSASMAMDDLEALPVPNSMPLPDPAPFSGRQMSNDTTQTDLDFVDQLLHMDEDDDDDEDEGQFLAHLEEPTTPNHNQHNRPDPELMQRLSDALAVLPKNMQEMIVERLIQSITSPDFEKNFVPCITPEPKQTTVEVNNNSAHHQAAVPLAAATLAALLQHLCAQASKDKDAAPTNKVISKILPVVPVHA
eukprot:scaffold6073_cov169-Amphora_coffeaeformis.AAC.2